MEEDMEWELSQSLVSDGSGVRGIGIVNLESRKGSSSEEIVDAFHIISGTQGGTLMEFGIPSGSLQAWQYQHDNAVTAVVCTEQDGSYVITGCKDSQIRILDGQTRQVYKILQGHDKPVTSLSCLGDYLVSGSWDGTAKVWNWKRGVLLATLSGHENSVCVAIVPTNNDNNNNNILQVVTGSAGIAQPDNKIRNHTVRMWNVNLHTGQVDVIYAVDNDHEGPIRDLIIFLHPPSNRPVLATCSNDGTVKLRYLETGLCTSTLGFSPKLPQQQAPMLLSLCCTTNGSLVASAEDGHVVVWDWDKLEKASSSSLTMEPQIILHPSCVWRVVPLPNGDFSTASDDGIIRIFTRQTERLASLSDRNAFAELVSEALSKRQGGPSSEEVAKLHPWERSLEKRGTSEGQVHLFRKGNIAIAAQWSMASQTWIEVGQVMGSGGGGGGNSNNQGLIDGVRYDHVLPVEFEQNGSVVNLKIGYNTGENPFTAAQRFIDAHMLPQYHLSQIADYIQQRTSASAPVLGSTTTATTSASAPVGVPIVSFQHIPAKHYLAFELDSKSAATVLDKMKAKLLEFRKLSDQDMARVSSLMEIIKSTNRYHVTQIQDVEILLIMLNKLDSSQFFAALDLARMTVLHPDAAERLDWLSILHRTISILQEQMKVGNANEVVVMLSLRLFANSLKGGTNSRKATCHLAESILVSSVQPHVRSNNKNVRLALCTLLYNLAYCSSTASQDDEPMPIPQLMGVLEQILSNHKLFEETCILRTLQALGTLCMAIPQAKQIAQTTFLASKVEPAASPHSSLVKTAAKEVYNVIVQ